MRARLLLLRDALGLEGDVQSAAQAIWGQCSSLREQLIELEGKRLKRYGERRTRKADRRARRRQ